MASGYDHKGLVGVSGDFNLDRSFGTSFKSDPLGRTDLDNVSKKKVQESSAHREVAQRAVEILRSFPEVQKIVLYGSVRRGEQRASSDVDLAVICHDEYLCVPLNFEGYPQGLRDGIDYSLHHLQKSSGIKIHSAIYWNQEFEKGISLGRDILNEVGSVIFDAEVEE